MATAHDETTTDLELVREWYAAIARGDGERIQAALAADVEWHEAEGLPAGGTYRSPEAVMENVVGPLGSEWEDFDVNPDHFLDCGDRIVVLGEYSGTYTATGRDVEAPFAHVVDVDDGRIQRFDQYTDTVLFQRATEP